MTTDAKEVMTVPKKEQNAGVALLLERMKTHPEEFYVENQLRMGSSKWTNLWQMYKDYFSEEDQEAYVNGLKEINQQRFTEHVLEGLVDPKVSSDGVTLNNIAHPRNTLLGGATPVRSSVTLNNANAVGTGTITANSLTLGNTTVTDTQLHQLLNMKAQMELEKQKAKQHQTLFGKLHNYLHGTI